MTADKVAAHYTHGRLIEVILEALRRAGADTAALSVDDLAPIDHLHGRGLAATRDLVAHLDPRADQHLVDIGSGIGGPARYLADRFGCRVTGIDLTPEFCDVARHLTELTGLGDRVAFHQGSALDLPFGDESFDGGYTHNVSMSICDKQRFFAEAFRVLRPGAAFVAAEVVLGPGGEVLYPAPWAMGPEISHLQTVAETEAVLARVGFRVCEIVDTSDKAIAFNEEARKRVARDGPPALSAALVLRDRVKERFRNAARNVDERRVVPVEFVCRR